jgi:hypothetical protein
MCHGKTCWLAAERREKMLIALGTIVTPHGRVAAVGVLRGERYYWMIDHAGTVSMMPAIVIVTHTPPEA